MTGRRTAHHDAIPRIPRGWLCPRHGAPTSYGCVRCGPIIDLLMEVVTRGHARTPALLRLAAELVLRYAADYAAHAVAPGEVKRSTRALAIAARIYVSAVPAPTRKRALV